MPKKKSVLGRIFKWLLIFGFVGVLVVAIAAGYLYQRVSSDLPPVDSLNDVQLQIPLRVYTEEGELIAEYGEKRREPVDITQVPEVLRNAILASEDAEFYSHSGVSFKGLARAAINLIKTGEKGQGGSTITMQVARNFFLSSEKTYTRKLNEIFLSFKIESALTKDEILELYLNKIYLGNRSYGFAAASKVYYGKAIGDINLAEAAMLAGLPKAPSRYNPIVNPERAKLRRDYVLRRLNELDWISQSDFDETVDLPVTASLHFSKPDAEAHYVGEMARARIKELYGDEWSTAGLSVYTTLKSEDQRAANAALRGALFDYEKRHGFTGLLGTLPREVIDDPEALEEGLDGYSNHGGMMPAVCILVADSEVHVRVASGEEYVLDFETDIAWARTRITTEELGPEITRATEVLTEGDVIYVWQQPDGHVTFVQEPQVEGALVAMDHRTGRLQALVGGFDFRRSKFNRVTQAKRQPGSTFKPFIYSAALEKGDTAATIYNDAPVVFHDDALEGEWRPSNYSGRFFGPTRLREALVKSRNLVSVRVLREIGIPYAIEYAQRFGFEESAMPPDLSLALGSASVTPLEVASGFAIFANLGYRVEPHFIERIEGPKGEIFYQAPEVTLCDECDTTQPRYLGLDIAAQTGREIGFEDAESANEELAALELVEAPRVIERRNAYIMRSMLKEVARRGTARKSAELERKDIGGKTGTTNNQLDAWFTGFNSQLVATAWVGSDGLTPLGRGEAGGVVALPMWISYMHGVQDRYSAVDDAEPEGIRTVRIDSKSGEPVSAGSDGSMLEIFRQEQAPASAARASVSQDVTGEERVTKKSTKTVRKKTKEKVDSLF